MRASDPNHDACPLSVHKLIHAKPRIQGEPDALRDPRLRQPFIKAGADKQARSLRLRPPQAPGKCERGSRKVLVYREVSQACVPFNTCPQKAVDAAKSGKNHLDDIFSRKNIV